MKAVKTKTMTVTEVKLGYRVSARWEGGQYADVWILAPGANDPVEALNMTDVPWDPTDRSQLRAELRQFIKGWDRGLIEDLLLAVGAGNAR